MEVNNFLAEKMIENLDINKKHKEKAISLIGIINQDEIIHYFNGMKEFPRTSKYKGINLDKLNTIDKDDHKGLQQFIKGANTNIRRFRKEPTNKQIRKIQNVIKQTDVSFDYYLWVNEKFTDNKHLMKKTHNEITNFFKPLLLDDADLSKNNINKIIENLSDTIEKNRLDSNGNKLMNAIISNKYKGLIDEDSVLLFKECAKQGITKKDLQNSIAPKLAAMRTPEDFNKLFANAIGFNEMWTKDYLKEKIKNANAEILLETDNNIYVDISSFEQSTLLGSKMWCLTREEGFLEDYLYKDHTRLIFKFDTSQNITDPNSYVAALFDGKELVEIYDKNDIPSKDCDICKEINSIDFPKSSTLTIKNKANKYEELSETDFIFESNSLFNLININRMDIIDKVPESNIDYYFPDYRSRSLSKLMTGLENKDGFEYILNNKKILDNTRENNPAYHIFMGAAINELVDVDDIIKLSKSPKIINVIDKFSEGIKRTDKGFNRLECTEYFFEKNNIEKTRAILDIFINKDIKPSHFTSSQSLKTLNAEMINLFIEYEPDYIQNCFELNTKRAIISLAQNDLGKNISNKIKKSIPNDERTHLLIKKYSETSLKRDDKELSERLQHWIDKPSNRPKLKR